MQLRGPALKGTKANGWRPCICSGKNRSGSKTRGFGQKLGSLCRSKMCMWTTVPPGTRWFSENFQVWIQLMNTFLQFWIEIITHWVVNLQRYAEISMARWEIIALILLCIAQDNPTAEYLWSRMCHRVLLQKPRQPQLLLYPMRKVWIGFWLIWGWWRKRNGHTWISLFSASNSNAKHNPMAVVSCPYKNRTINQMQVVP